MRHETNTSKIIARLERDGWINVGGSKHTKFKKPGVPFVIMVPRHSVVTAGVAKSIAAAAGWK
jgi:predicted RNA binding protein YcfA (HicA-like mRNA interferase family)